MPPKQFDELCAAIRPALEKSSIKYLVLLCIPRIVVSLSFRFCDVLVLTEILRVTFLSCLNSDWPLRCDFWPVVRHWTYWTWPLCPCAQYIKSSGPRWRPSIIAKHSIFPTIWMIHRCVRPVLPIFSVAVQYQTPSRVASGRSMVFSFASLAAPPSKSKTHGRFTMATRKDMVSICKWFVMHFAG